MVLFVCFPEPGHNGAQLVFGEVVDSSIFLEGNESVCLAVPFEHERTIGRTGVVLFAQVPGAKSAPIDSWREKRETAQVGPASETQEGRARKSGQWHRRFGAYGPDS